MSFAVKKEDGEINIKLKKFMLVVIVYIIQKDLEKNYLLVLSEMEENLNLNLITFLRRRGREDDYGLTNYF